MIKGSHKTHCKRGHERTPENVGSNGACKQCLSITTKAWGQENPEKINLLHKRRNEKRRGKRKSNSAYMKKYY